MIVSADRHGPLRSPRRLRTQRRPFALVPDAKRRCRASALLASERDVPDETLRRDPRSFKQHLPRNVGNAPAAGTGDAQVHVALALRFGDRASAPVRIESSSMGGDHGTHAPNITRTRFFDSALKVCSEIAPESTGHGLPLSKCEAYDRVYDPSFGSH